MAPLAGQKRKVDYNAPGTPAQVRKRQKGKDARAISTQTADAALSKTGELNLASFVKAREFEIAALQQSMRRSKNSLTQRAFQQVPRHMRRRTASHNVKKIPRRLQARASREIKEDNTPTGKARTKKISSKLRLRLDTAKRLQKLNTKRKSVRQKKRESKANAKEADPAKHVEIERVPRLKKNKLVNPPQATSKFKRRQINKTWLPTHLWHTKRAHMTPPTLPLWRMAIPLRPTEKVYRATHRAAGSRGCVAWDASYISTIGCQGTELALDSMLKALGFGFGNDQYAAGRLRKWKAGTRHRESWMFDKDGKKPIAPVTVLWQVRPTTQNKAQTPGQMDIHNEHIGVGGQSAERRNVKLDRRLFLRVHPSGFHQLWLEIIKVAKMQNPQVLVEDLRFEIGSIIVQGPQSTEALTGVMKLSQNQPHIEDLWPRLSALNNPGTLPSDALMVVDILDSRLHHPPKRLPVRQDEKSMNKLNELIVLWPLDTNTPPSSLFDHKVRYSVSKSLPSQKAINRRRASLPPGQPMETQEKDPRIPAILLAHRSSRLDSNMQGHCTLMLPWSCVDIVWRSLMYYPLLTGGVPRFGGLDQTQQVAFEQSHPWYPADFPGTQAGKAWERTQSEDRFDKWLRRPPSKRHAWDALDLGLNRRGELGRGWTCDWEYLLRDTAPTVTQVGQKPVPLPTTNLQKSTQPRLLTQKQRKAAAAKAENDKEARSRRRNSSSPESEDGRADLHNDVEVEQLLPLQSAASVTDYHRKTLPSIPELATVRIRFLTRGTPSPAARVYRLPLADTSLSDTNVSAGVNGSNAPLPSNATPNLFPDASGNTAKEMSLRKRWLDLDPNPLDLQANTRSSTSLPQPIGAQKTNRHGDPVAHTAYDEKHTRDLTHIRVFPPRETKPEVLNMYGPPPPPKTQEETSKLLQPQLVPRMVVDSNGDLVEEDIWDKHVPCPGPEDLIGFVTTGGYNLTEGRGTAIASLWIQRVINGWKEEDKHNGNDDLTSTTPQGTSARNVKTDNAKLSKEQAQRAKARKQRQQRITRERHLCIVRNAGESIGRLAIWELC